MRNYKNFNCDNCDNSFKMKIVDDCSAVYCPYCGELCYLDDYDEESITINKNINIDKYIHNRYTNDADVIRANIEASESKNAPKIVLTIFCVMLLIPALILGGLFINKVINEGQRKISAGYYGDLIGENYKTVKAHFESAGFTNIELINLKDSGIAFWNDGKVSKISVGGKTDFEDTDYFDPDVKVVISYH